MYVAATTGLLACWLAGLLAYWLTGLLRCALGPRGQLWQDAVKVGMDRVQGTVDISAQAHAKGARIHFLLTYLRTYVLTYLLTYLLT